MSGAGRAGVVALAAALAAAALPGTAAAHAGKSAPVATSFLARIASTPDGIDAQVVDGDQRLWLRADPRLTVVVLGFSGEPFLRFSATGVEVNERSATSYADRNRPVKPPPGLTPTTPPQWRRVSGGHVYSWHEDRLHALAVAAHGPETNAFVGRWIVPLRIDGRAARIAGGLWHANDPTIVWFWPIAVVLLSVWALARPRRPRLTRALRDGLVALTPAAIVVGVAGRTLYGRPGLSAWRLTELAVVCCLAVLAAVLVARRKAGAVTVIVVGVAGLTTGLTLVGTLLHGYVLSRLPADVERGAAVAAIACGTAALLVGVFYEPDPAVEHRRRVGDGFARIQQRRAET